MTHIASFAPEHDFQRGYASHAAFPLLARNDNNPGDERCPACRRPTVIAPAASEYRAEGIIRRHWRCSSCGHAWITVVRVMG